MPILLSLGVERDERSGEKKFVTTARLVNEDHASVNEIFTNAIDSVMESASQEMNNVIKSCVEKATKGLKEGLLSYYLFFCC